MANGVVTLALPLVFFLREMRGLKRCFESPAGTSGLLMNACAALDSTSNAASRRES